MTLGRNIRSKRNACGLDQQELAERIGVTPAAVCYFEADKKIPSVTVLVSIADVLLTSIDELLGRKVV